jgi:hypothetical protein
MNDIREMPEQLAYFQKYAEEKLQDHVDIIEAQYQHKKTTLAQKSIAYKRHQKIFENELSKKVDQLAPLDFDYIRHALWSMKHYYAKRLCRV